MDDNIDNNDSLSDDGESSALTHDETVTLTLQFKQACDEVRDLKARLKRRTHIVEELRKSYLKDVVALKHVVEEVLTDSENEMVNKQYMHHIPSIDLRDPLILHGPKEAEFRLKPCDNCGGCIDIVINDNELVKRLKNRIEDYKIQENTFRLHIAKIEQQIEVQIQTQEATDLSIAQEKKVFYKQLADMREALPQFEMEKSRLDLENRKIRQRSEDLRKENEFVKRELAKARQIEKDLLEQQERLPLILENLRVKEAVEGMQKVKLEANEKEISDLQAMKVMLMSDVEELRKELSESIERQNRYKELAEQIESALELSNKKCNEIESKLVDKEDENKKISHDTSSEIIELGKKLEVAREDIRSGESYLRSQKRECGVLGNKVKALELELMKKEDIIIDKDDEIRNLNAELETSAEEMHAMKHFLASDIGNSKSSGGGSMSKLKGAVKDIIGGRKPATPTAPTPTTTGGLADSVTFTSSSSSVVGDNSISSGNSSGRNNNNTDNGNANTPGGGSASSTPRKQRQQQQYRKQHQQQLQQQQQTDAIGLNLKPNVPTSHEEHDHDQDEIDEDGQDDQHRRKSSASSFRSYGNDDNTDDHFDEQHDDNGSIDTLVSTTTITVEGGGGNINSGGTNSARANKSPLTSSFGNLSNIVDVLTTTTKKENNKRKTKTEENIQLNPPRENATKEELSLRNEFLDIISQNFSPNMAKKIFNVCSTYVHSYGDIIAKLLQSLWSALLISKRSLDFDVKMKIVLDGIVSCSELTEPSQIAEVCAEIVPIAGGGMLGAKLTPVWEKQTEIDSEIVFKLTSVVDAATGNIIDHTYDNYFELDKLNANTLNKQMLTVKDTISKMSFFNDESLILLSSLTIEVVREWSQAKTVFIEIDDRIAQCKEEVKSRMNAEVNILKKELQMGQTKFQSLRDNARILEIELADRMKTIYELRDLPDQIKEAHEAVSRMKHEKEIYSQKVGKELNSLENMKQDLISTNNELIEISTKYEILDKIHEGELKRFLEFELLQEQTIQESTRIKNEIFRIHEKERIRQETNKSVAIQCKEPTAECEVQTEFITTDMTLRTVIEARNNELQRRHPLIISSSTGNNFNDKYIHDRIFGKSVASLPTPEEKRLDLEKSLLSLSSANNNNNNDASMQYLSDELSTTSAIYSRMQRHKNSKLTHKNIILASGVDKKILTPSRGDLLPNSSISTHLNSQLGSNYLRQGSFSDVKSMDSSFRSRRGGDDDGTVSMGSTTSGNRSIDFGLPKVKVLGNVTTLSSARNQDLEDNIAHGNGNGNGSSLYFNTSASGAGTARLVGSSSMDNISLNKQPISRAMSPLTNRSPPPSWRGDQSNNNGLGKMSYTNINKSIILDEFRPNNNGNNRDISSPTNISDLQKQYFGKSKK